MDITPPSLYCKKCGRKLTQKNTVILVENINGRFYFDLKSAPVPESEIVSRQPFGKDCAVKVGFVYRKDGK